VERYQEVMVALSESVMKNRLKHPLAEKSLCYYGSVSQYVIVALSESVMKNSVKRPLVEK